MISKIANILKNNIEALEWIDKISGMVITVNVQEKVGDNVITKSYPVSCDITSDDCIKGHYKDLIPDSKKKSVVYFEDIGGTQFVKQEGNRLYYRASLRLVAWLNYKLLNEDSCGVASVCENTGDYVLSIIKSLSYMPFDEDELYGIKIYPPKQAEKSSDIFGRYTYAEEAVQYLMYPFDYFALDFEVDFIIPCVDADDEEDE